MSLATCFGQTVVHDTDFGDEQTLLTSASFFWYDLSASFAAYTDVQHGVL